MTNNQTVCPNSESSCSIDGGIEIMEANVDTKLSDDKDADQKELFPRDYQLELFHAAREENTIVYLQTGSGKTFISVLLIREMASETMRPLNEKGQRIVFLVPTIVLAQQQAKYLRKHTSLNVSELHGSSKNVKFDQIKLTKELDKNNVLVMTYQTFLIILNHNFLDIEQVNLLVVDECHSVVKDSPMKNIMEFIYRASLLGKMVPRVLGLTAALFRKQCKPVDVCSMVKDLETAMNARVRTASDIHSALRNSTKPTEVIIECRRESMGLDHVNNIRMISLIKKVITSTLKALKLNCIGDKVLENSVNILKEIGYLTEAFGSFGTNYGVTLYNQDIENLRSLISHSDQKSSLSQIVDTFDEIKRIFGSEIERPPIEQINYLTTPRVLRLLEVLRKFRPWPDDSNSGGQGALCGIIFVARRSSANLLCHLLSLASCHDETLSFIHPLFTVGQTTGNSNKQKAVFEKFCNSTCNLLVATSVLEEGVDVRACNLVIRFDPVKTFCDFVQSKGRARSPNALYCMMVEETDGGHSTTDSSVDSLAQFHAIEQILLNGGRSKDQGAEDQKKYWDNPVSTYRPDPDGPCITLSSAMVVINRYCASLPSGQKTVLTPHWTTEEILDLSTLDEKYLRHLKNSPGVRKNKYFQSKLSLPLNSPLRSEVIGQVMATKQLAKQMVALDTCIRLHELNELDDEHLLPTFKESKKIQPELNSSSKKTAADSAVVYESFYRKASPVALVDCMPQTNQDNYLYVLDYDLVQGIPQNNNSFNVETLEWKLGLLTSKPLPQVNAFPIFTKVGMVDVRFHLESSRVRINREMIRLCASYQRYAFNFLAGIRLARHELIHELSSFYMVVPIKMDGKGGLIDTDMMEMIRNFSIQDEANKKYMELTSKQRYEGHEPHYRNVGSYIDRFHESFHNTVVISCHYKLHRVVGHRNQTFSKMQTHPFYVESVSRLTPLSYYPERAFFDFKDFYRKSYNIDILHDHQPLLEVCKESSKSLTFLTPKYLNRKVKVEEPAPKRPNKWGLTEHLVPEFCITHPCPASLWKQTAWMPSILYRLNTLLLAEEFRLRIVREAQVGSEHNPTEWEPLRNIVPNSFLTSEEPKSADSVLTTLQPFYEIIVEESDTNIQDEEIRMNRGIKRKRDETGENGSKFSAETQQAYGIERIRFDDNDVFPVEDVGPSPARILQSLTTQFTNCGFSLERLETIGDSFLKLATSVYAYCTCTSHEGKLSEFRMHQICNKNLCKLGQKLCLPQIMSAEKFLPKENWLPPPYGVRTDQDVYDVINIKQKEILGDDRKQKIPNPRIWHNITNKSIADAIESLIGTYLTCNGIRGALKLMKWIGIEVPEPGVGLSCFGVDVPSPLLTDLSNADDILNELLTNFDRFEEHIDYRFKNRYFLLQAFSHASFHPNRLTNCYQRLEFLGDAVLDYLVTRYLYEDVELYSPGKMTDLRSALVNNYLFSVIAVRNGFHNYLKHKNPNLQTSIDKFIQRQEECDHMVLDEVMRSMLTPDTSELLPEDIEVPKVLGDIFESVAGAIFLDSGMSLDAVWKVFYPLMTKEIDTFCQQLPISPIRKLHETVPGLVKLLKFGQEEGQFCAAFEVEDIGVFKGAGRNIRLAKCNAARYALAELENPKLINKKLLAELKRQSVLLGHQNNDATMSLEQMKRFTSLIDRVSKQIPSSQNL